MQVIVAFSQNTHQSSDSATRSGCSATRRGRLSIEELADFVEHGMQAFFVPTRQPPQGKSLRLSIVEGLDAECLGRASPATDCLVCCVCEKV